MTAQRTNEPTWCRHGLAVSHVHHVSRERRAGNRRDGGEAAVWLRQDPNRKPVVGLLTAQMGSNAIELGLEDARRLRDALTGLLQTVDADR